MRMRLWCGLKMHNKKVKRLFFIFSIILLSLFLLAVDYPHGIGHHLGCLRRKEVAF